MKKIGVISDTHTLSYAKLPDKLLQALKGVDLILHAGDITSLAVLEGLRKIGPELRAVWGNMDPPEVKRLLPEVEIIQIGKLRLGLTHGSGPPFGLIGTLRKKFKDQQVDCIVYGHSHSPHNALHENILFFNPGSPTDKFFAPYNSYGILQADTEISGKIVKI